MTIWALVPIWQRHALTRVVLTYLARVSRVVAKSGIDFRVLTVGSEGSLTENLAAECLDPDTHKHIEAPNEPLGAKLNAGGHEIWKLEPDGMMILGSDDLITPGYVCEASNALLDGVGVVGFADIAFYDLPTKRLVHWANTWTQTHADQPVGAGRVWAHEALDVYRGRLWQDSRDHGLDTCSWGRLKRWRDCRVVRRFAMDETLDRAVVDIKGGGTNIWEWDRIKRSLGVHADNAEVDFTDLPEGWMTAAFGAHVVAQLDAIAP